jgi:hypothetical protein
LISAMRTAAPFAAKRKAIACPMPLPPPVTMATLPSSLKSFAPLPGLFRARYLFSRE